MKSTATVEASSTPAVGSGPQHGSERHGCDANYESTYLFYFHVFRVGRACFFAIPRPRDFEVPRLSDARSLFRMRCLRLAFNLVFVLTTHFQRIGQDIPINAPIVRIARRSSSQEVARCGADRRTCRFALGPNTKRRLSGWSSKIRMLRIFFRASFARGTRIS